VTDSLPALALSVDPADPDVMKRKPAGSNRSIMNKRFSLRVMLQGTMIGVLSIIAFWIGMNTSIAAGLPQETCEAVARTMTFAVLAFTQIVHVFNVRSNDHSAFRGFCSNKYLLGAAVIVIGLMLIVLEVPVLHTIFHLSALTSTQWGWVTGLSLAPLPVMELTKRMVRICCKKR
jgi:Ca2+-transporting ATPase